MSLELGSLFLQTFVISLSGAAAPGPLMMVAMTRGLRHGPTTGLWVTLGHGLLEVALVAAVAFGLAQALHTRLWTTAIAGAGGIVLLAMGLTQLRAAWLPHVAAGVGPSAKVQTEARAWSPRRGAVLAGVAATASNPYWYVWWLTVGATLISRAQAAGNGALPVFYAGHLLADGGWLTLVAWLIARGRSVLSERGYRFLLSTLAVFLIGFGIFFLQNGVQQILP